MERFSLSASTVIQATWFATHLQVLAYCQHNINKSSTGKRKKKPSEVQCSVIAVGLYGRKRCDGAVVELYVDGLKAKGVKGVHRCAIATRNRSHKLASNFKLQVEIANLTSGHFHTTRWC